ncbi:MAG: thioredoxin family protein [Calditrichaeota bacterium]|nr:MAG: thioredoxin family protein [Calditrichota bacterium]
MAFIRFKIGDTAPNFHELPCVDGNKYSMEDFKDKRILVIIFMCNHCPYVQAYQDRIINLQKIYSPKGVQIIGINSNDTSNYPEDDFEHMIKISRDKGYNFPYLRDASQRVAAAYGAKYTPEVFVLDMSRKLRYHGRIDDNWKSAEEVESPDLRLALDAILNNQEVPIPETRPVGCTIKWSTN